MVKPNNRHNTKHKITPNKALTANSVPTKRRIVSNILGNTDNAIQIALATSHIQEYLKFNISFLM